MSTTDLVANTEAEILAFALDKEPEELSSYRHDADFDDTLEMTESWDGDPVDIDEAAEIAEKGWPDSGYDRPLQLAQDQGYEDTIAQMEQENAAMRQQIAELSMRADPGMQARQAAAREELMYNIIAQPESVVEYASSLESQNREMRDARANASLAAAHREHGEDFEAAYQSMTSMDPAHPAARALVQSIYDSPDPGQALMEFHIKSGGQAMPRAVGGQFSRGHLPPSLNSRERGFGGTPSRSSGRSQRESRSEWPGDDDYGSVDPAAERAIWDGI